MSYPSTLSALHLEERRFSRAIKWPSQSVHPNSTLPNLCFNPFSRPNQGAGLGPVEKGGAFSSYYRIDLFASLFPSAAVRTRGSSRYPILDRLTVGSRVIGSLLNNSARWVNDGRHELWETGEWESHANLNITNVIDDIDESESGCRIRSNANRPQTYGTDRNLSKQTAYLHFHEQHHAAGAREERKTEEKTRALPLFRKSPDRNRHNSAC